MGYHLEQAQEEWERNQIYLSGHYSSFSDDELIATCKQHAEFTDMESIVHSICIWHKEKGFITKKQRMPLIIALAEHAQPGRDYNNDCQYF